MWNEKRINRDTILDSAFVKRVCRSIGFSKYAERWVYIRSVCLTRLGIPNVMSFPDNLKCDKLVERFKLASRAFDKLLYKGGARWTGKDGSYKSEHELARHNFPNYNLVIHQLLWQLECRKLVNAHFFFPLLVTEKVLHKLLAMWTIIAEECKWDVAPYETLVHPRYELDWEVAFQNL